MAAAAAGGGGIASLPEDCIHRILAFTTPGDVGRVATLTKALHQASMSDAVWQAFLPPCTCHFADVDAQDAPLQYSSKRDLYLRLCSPTLLKNGVQKYWLDYSTGQECHILSARALSITWGTDERYWNWIPQGDSWFQEVAYLNRVCWFEVRGSFHHLFQMGQYTVSFRIKMPQDRSPFLGYRQARWPVMSTAREWSRCPVKFALSVSNGYHRASECFLKYGTSSLDATPPNPDATSSTVMRTVNGWIECDIGEFTVEDATEPLHLDFSMVEIEGGDWKSGLTLDGLLIQPSSLVIC